MTATIFAFVYKYFFTALITFAVAMFSKSLVKQFGNDRATKIKETILAAMLWAEQEFGVGTGNKKWEEAWKKIIELLGVQGITLTANETSTVETLMKANVPQINSVVYSALPDKALEERKVRSVEVTKIINNLKDKHAV